MFFNNFYAFIIIILKNYVKIKLKKKNTKGRRRAFKTYIPPPSPSELSPIV